MTRSKIFLALLLSFIAGVGLGSFFDRGIYAAWIGAVVSLAVVAIGLRIQRAAIIVGFCALFFCIGIVRFEYVKNERPDLSAIANQNAEFTGVIADDPTQTQNSQQFNMTLEKINGADVPYAPMLSVALRVFPSYQMGDRLRIRGMLDTAHEKSDVIGTILFPRAEKIGAQKVNALLLFLARSKRAFEARIDAALPEPHAGFMKGLLLGERSTLPASLIEEFKRTGTSHIIALSGYNITVIGTSLVNVLLFLTVSFRMSFWIACAGILYFVFLTGASSSLTRAAIMGILVLVAQREGRFYQMTNALVFAGASMIFYNPYLLRFDISFQLSFLATIGLVFLSPAVERLYYRAARRASSLLGFKQKIIAREEHVLARAIKNTLVQTIAAQLAVLPLIIYLFGGVSLLTPLTNLLVLPAVPYAMLAGFLTGGFGLVWQPMGTVFGWVSWVLLEYQLRVIGFFSAMPFSLIAVPTAGLMLVMVCYIWASVAWWRNK